MNTKLLLPHHFKKWGWILIVLSTLMWLIMVVMGDDSPELNATVFAIYQDGLLNQSHSFGLVWVDALPTMVGTIFIVGSLLIIFTSEKEEDEFIGSLRMSSFQWAVLVNYLLLLLAFLFIYGISFTQVMMYNMFTIPIIFIVRFYYLLYRNSKLTADEK